MIESSDISIGSQNDRLAPADLAKALRMIGINEPKHDWTMQEAAIMLEQLESATPQLSELTADDLAGALMDAHHVSDRARGDSDVIADAVNEAQAILDALPWKIYHLRND